MKIIIYRGGADDVIVESIALNGREGAVNVTDSSDDIDMTFEDIETAREWLSTVIQGLAKLEASL